MQLQQSTIQFVNGKLREHQKKLEHLKVRPERQDATASRGQNQRTTARRTATDDKTESEDEEDSDNYLAVLVMKKLKHDGQLA